MGTNEHREGHYKDKYGRWQRDRRAGGDRRATGEDFSPESERRKLFRRKQDREILEKDHREQIKDALDDFAEEHGGHL